MRDEYTFHWYLAFGMCLVRGRIHKVLSILSYGCFSKELLLIQNHQRKLFSQVPVN